MEANMVKFEIGDLRKAYSWETPEEIADTIEGFPSDLVLNCKEGYEVLYFINRYMDDIDWITIKSFNNIELLIRDWLPLGSHTHLEVKKWLDLNLKRKSWK
jgi:hypothetical protein